MRAASWIKARRTPLSFVYVILSQRGIYYRLSDLITMEPATAVAGFLALIPLVHNAAQSLYHCANLWSSARVRVVGLADEASMFAGLLMALHKITIEAQKKIGFKTGNVDAKVCRRITKQGKAAVRMMEESLHKLEPLQSDSGSSQLRVFFARLRWLITAEDFTPILMSIISVKTSAMLFLGILQLEVSLYECQQCIANHQAIPEDLRNQVFVISKPQAFMVQLTRGQNVLSESDGSSQISSLDPETTMSRCRECLEGPEEYEYPAS